MMFGKVVEDLITDEVEFIMLDVGFVSNIVLLKNVMDIIQQEGLVIDLTHGESLRHADNCWVTFIAIYRNIVSYGAQGILYFGLANNVLNEDECCGFDESGDGLKTKMKSMMIKTIPYYWFKVRNSRRKK